MTNTAILAASALIDFAHLIDTVGKRFRLPSAQPAAPQAGARASACLSARGCSTRSASV